MKNIFTFALIILTGITGYHTTSFAGGVEDDNQRIAIRKVTSTCRGQLQSVQGRENEISNESLKEEYREQVRQFQAYLNKDLAELDKKKKADTARELLHNSNQFRKGIDDLIHWANIPPGKNTNKSLNDHE